jgi:hypothetical protein
MSTKFQKKPVTRREPVQPAKKSKKPAKAAEPKRYLYFRPKGCDFSIELLNILALAPTLAKKIRCVNILEYDVTGIKRTPAIDDGVSDKPHEGTKAFQWVMNECYKMLNMGTLNRDTVSRVEIKIRQMSQRVSRNGQAPIDRGHMRMNKSRENPLEKWDGTTSIDNLTPAVYAGVNIQDQFMDLQRRRARMAIDGTQDAERMKNSESSRMQMLEQAQRIWREEGRLDENGSPRQREMIRREELKARAPTVSMSDLRKYEEAQAAMYADSLATGHAPQARAPISRHASQMGTAR